MASGYGQFHTNEPDAQNPDKKLTPYITIDLDEIQELVDNPQKVDKSLAQWFIPSTLLSRNFKAQERHGSYYVLWADLDDSPPSLPDLQPLVEGILGGADYELYNSRSAKPDNQKARILVFLNAPLCFQDWNIGQQILNEKLADAGVIADPANTRAAQLCYLPNAGDFYGSRSKRDGVYFDPLQYWQSELAQHQKIIEAEQLAVGSAQAAALERRAVLTLSGNPNLITVFNEAYTPQQFMLAAGYQQKGNGFRHPNSSTGNYSATLRPDSNGLLRVNALSSGDPLNSNGQGARDAFDCFTILMHGGNKTAALKDAGDNLLMIGDVSFNRARQKQYAKNRQAEAEQQAASNTAAPAPPEDQQAAPAPLAYAEPSNYNDILDKERRYCSVDLLQHIAGDSLIKRLSKQIAFVTDIPESTVFLSGLAVYSAIAARNWCVNYPDGTALPIGLYVVAEQPSGTGKSRCLNTFQKPFFKSQKIALKNINARIKELENQAELGESEERELKHLSNRDVMLFVTNTTSEGLEVTLPQTNGFFSAVSAEQGLFDSLLGLSYGTSKNNNDLALLGFDGSHMSSCRAKRKGYVGEVVGSVVSFAQQGSIEKVLDSSNGTGLSERFLMIAEPHALGSRDHAKQVAGDYTIEADYAKLCEFAIDVLETPKEFAELNCLLISEQGDQLITDYRNHIEPHLKDGGVFSHVSLRSAASKVNMQVMKIAAVLHLLDGSGDYQYNIPDRHVVSAIAICNELLRSALVLCKNKGIMGAKAEYTAILNYISKGNKTKSELEIKNSMRNTMPFKDYTGSRADLVTKTLKDMCEQRLLTINFVGSKPIYSLAQ